MTNDFQDLPDATADVWDAVGDRADSCDTQMRDYGGRTRFRGVVRTVCSREDNMLLKSVVAEPGNGGVIVVDGGGTTHCAMLGDNMARRAADSGWAGIIIHGAIRDSVEVGTLPIGVKALGTNPRRSRKDGDGTVDVPVSFGGARFEPGDYVIADEDGIIVLAGNAVSAAQ